MVSFFPISFFQEIFLNKSIQNKLLLILNFYGNFRFGFQTGSLIRTFSKTGPNIMPGSRSTTLANSHTCFLWRIFWRRYRRTPCERPWRRCGRSQGSGSGCQWWCFQTVSCLLMYIYNQFRIRVFRKFGFGFPKDWIGLLFLVLPPGYL